ncbi:hypothetical protein CC78DRAFT_585419 [Lojkania enalia]|uniref:Uncharacterized protein n=1 Tax=Lojkania enalia TaxID=147567 RepID=A0A9P4K235_9PLEO|nr:hypothetical protein CC78DRAFT_585419 [Didymosphaeria enalia]
MVLLWYYNCAAPQLLRSLFRHPYLRRLDRQQQVSLRLVDARLMVSVSGPAACCLSERPPYLLHDDATQVVEEHSVLIGAHVVQDASLEEEIKDQGVEQEADVGLVFLPNNAKRFIRGTPSKMLPRMMRVLTLACPSILMTTLGPFASNRQKKVQT